MKKTVIIIIIFFILINLMACGSNKSDNIDSIEFLTDKIIETSKINFDEFLKEELLKEAKEEEVVEKIKEEDEIFEDYLTINSEDFAQLQKLWKGDWYRRNSIKQ